MLEQSSAPVRKNVDGPDDKLQPNDISTLLIEEGNLGSLYNRILDAAIDLMSSDMASIQLLDPDHNELRLLASRGFIRNQRPSGKGFSSIPLPRVG